MTVPDEDMHTGAPGRLDNLRRLGKREAHRLFDQQVLTRGSTQAGVFGMELVRRGNV